MWALWVEKRPFGECRDAASRRRSCGDSPKGQTPCEALRPTADPRCAADFLPAPQPAQSLIFALTIAPRSRRQKLNFMYLKRILGFALLSILLCQGTAQAQTLSPKEMLEKADAFYEAEKYDYALPYYLKYQNEKPKYLEAKLRIGVCYFMTNRMELAEKYLEYMVQQRKPEPMAYLYLARTMHQQYRFQDAIKYYKLYLGTLDNKDNQKYVIKDEIRRCARGLKLIHAKKLAIVENLGDLVNTSGDDFSPVLNDAFPNTLFFSSCRPGNVGDRLDEYGQPDTLRGKYRADIYKTELDRGVWNKAQRLQGPINTASHDIVHDFSDGGKFIYWGISKYLNYDYMDIFREEYTKSPQHIPFKFPLTINSGEWDADPFFFNDSVMIFASDRLGGFGGKDLYYTKLINGEWSAPANLGAPINTPYDEVAPHLSRDGKVLYFSSNNVEGMGGFDVYRVSFNEQDQTWEDLMNLGTPINSPGDENYFRLSADGMRSFFASSRADGYGGYDIYVAYFKRPMVEQLNTSTYVSFDKYLFPDTPKAEKKPVVTQGPVAEVEKELMYQFSPLFYQDFDNLLLRPESIRQLNQMISLMQKYDVLTLELTSHTDSYGPQNYNLQSSLANAESVAEYLEANGIPLERIVIKGVGQLYPIAIDMNPDGSDNPQGRTLNRRIEMRTYGEEGIPVIIENNIPDVSASLSAPDGTRYNAQIEGLSYRVEIKSATTMLDDAILTDLPDAMVEKRAHENTKHYTVGFVKTYDEVKSLLAQVQAKGFTDAKVVIYVDGERITPASASNYVMQFPDLQFFIDDNP